MVMASDSEAEWCPKYSAEVPWRLNVEAICGSVPRNTGLRASQKRTVSLSEYVLVSRNFCFRTDHGNSHKGGGKWPVLVSSSQAALGSAVLRLGTVATKYQPAGVSTRASVTPYHMTKEFFRLCPTFPATWLCSYRKTGDFWLLVTAVSQQPPQDIHRGSHKTPRHLSELFLTRNTLYKQHKQYRTRC